MGRIHGSIPIAQLKQCRCLAMLQRKLDVLFPQYAIVVLQDFLKDGSALAIRYEADESVDIEALEKEIREHSVPEEDSDEAQAAVRAKQKEDYAKAMTLHNIKNGLLDLPEWKQDIEKRLAVIEKQLKVAGDGK